MQQKNSHVLLMRHKLRDDRRLFKEWKISSIKAIYRRRYMFKKCALEILFKEGYSVLLSFPEGDYEVVIKDFVEKIKVKNSKVKPFLPNQKINEKYEAT